MSIEVNFESLKSIGKGSTCAIYPYDEGHEVKKYNPEILRGRAAELQSFIKDMIKVRSSADAKMRDFVDRLFTWPLDIVTESGEFCGFIMNRIPDGYRWEYTSNGKRRECSLDMELAYSGADNLRKKGLPLPDRNGRVIISQWLIIAVRLMHLSHITMRDISSKNVFVRFDPIDQRNSKVLFVDVDSYCGYRVAGLKNPLDTSETPGWRTPDADEPVSPSKDIFKICLAIARLYQTGKVTTLDISGTKREYESKLKEYYGEAFRRISMEVSPSFAECVKRGLSYNAVDRPDVDELFSVLQSSLQTAAKGKNTTGKYANGIITLKLADGTTVECDTVGTFELNRKTYIALRPRDNSGDTYIYGYRKVCEDVIEIRWLESQEELKAAQHEYDAIMADQ